jgi:hypothetical protein
VSFLLLGDWPDPTASVLTVLRRGGEVARGERPEVWAGIVEPLLRGHLDARGHLAERRALGGAGAAPAALVRDALLGALPAAAGDAAAAAWLAADTARADPQPLVWLAERRDTAALARYAARAEAAPAPADSGARLARRRGAALARGYLAVARGDTAGGLARLGQVTRARVPGRVPGQRPVPRAAARGGGRRGRGAGAARRREPGGLAGAAHGVRRALAARARPPGRAGRRPGAGRGRLPQRGRAVGGRRPGAPAAGGGGAGGGGPPRRGRGSVAAR